jgi:DNA-binding transcriptional MerR regulator
MTADDASLLTVGQLARRSGLTAKALRHYDRVGLLEPALIDSVNGYRRYRLEQLAHASLVRLLRELDVPLDEIRALGLEPSQAEVAMTLRGHRLRLEAELVGVQRRLHVLDHVIEQGWNSVATTEHDAGPLDAATETTLAAALFNGVWTLLEQPNRTPDDDARMLHMAHAQCHHWNQVGTAVNFVRAEWQCSRVYATLRRSEPALYHARRALQLCEAAGIEDFDLAYCYEALARAHAVSGDDEAARTWRQRGLDAAQGVADDDDRALLLADLESIPH